MQEYVLVVMRAEFQLLMVLLYLMIGILENHSFIVAQLE